MNDVELVIVLAIYFAPTIAAAMRKHKSQGGIAVINLFFGWTIVGWVLALAWAAADPGRLEEPKQEVERKERKEPRL